MLITNYLLRFKLQQNIFPLLGIDLGTAFTGFSITYNLKNLQIYDLHYSNCYSPNDATLYKKIISIIKKEKIGGIVIGKPEKKSKQHVKDFTTEFTEGLISNLQSQNLTTYVTQINEDNTTIQAQRISKSKEKFLNDGLASLLILQRFLNSQ